jgi:catechol 2,3-dioxygenase-like lactoylglutathione lyase family enzyme
MQIEGLDHLVLTVADLGRTRDFYERVLSMEPVVFSEGRHALAFGTQKINLHEAGREFEPKSAVPTPGSADLCFLTDAPVAEVVEHLGANDVEILEGPVRRTGATGPITSVYFRDPDGNLIEVSSRLGA